MATKDSFQGTIFFFFLAVMFKALLMGSHLNI